MMTRDDARILGGFCNRDESGKHFLEIYNSEWTSLAEAAGWIKIYRPIHGATGISYSQEYWRAEVTEEGAEEAEALDFGLQPIRLRHDRREE